MQLHGFAAGPYNTNTYVLAHEGEAFVVDPGMHSHRQVEKALAETSASLVAVVLTHGHIDHTRDAGSLAAQYDVPVHIHPEDAFMLAGGDGISQRSQVLFDAAHMTPVRDLRDLHDGQDLTLAGVELKVRHAPGHSPGSCLLVHEQFAFTGDVIFQARSGAPISPAPIPPRWTPPSVVQCGSLMIPSSSSPATGRAPPCGRSARPTRSCCSWVCEYCW